MSRHRELKQTYKPGQQWQFNCLEDNLGWEDCYEAREPDWSNHLEYRIKPEKIKCPIE